MLKKLILFGVFSIIACANADETLFCDLKERFAKVKENRKSHDVFFKTAPALKLDGRFPSTGNHVGQVFYFNKQQRDQLKGKNAVLRFKAKRLAGNNTFSAGFRILERKTWRPLGHRYDKIPLPEKNVWYDCEVPFTIPDLPTTGSNNINFQFGQVGKENTVIIIDEVKIYIADKAPEVKFAECASLGRAQRYNRKPLYLIKDKKPLFSIVIPEKANDIAVIAAQELQYHFQLVTGKKVPIVREKAVKGPAFHIGNTKLAQKYGVSPDMIPAEHYVIARVGNDIILSGGDGKDVKRRTVLSLAGVPLGTMNAVYGFLEKYLNVRWYWPGKDGMVIPPVKDISVTTLYENGQPYFSTRTLYTSHFPKTDPISGVEQALWKRRLRLGGKLIGPIANHGFYWLAKKYADTKPELFTLQKDGTRKANARMGVHVCFSNPELLEITVREALDYFRKNPHQSFFRVMPGDAFHGFVCNCKGCQNLYQPEKGEFGSASDMVWGFVNKVAQRVSAVLPGKYINCCAYENYKLPPSFPLSGNVSVTICHGEVPWAGQQAKESLRKVLDLWEPTGARLYVWEYWLTRYNRASFGAPVIFPRHLEEMSAMKRSRIAGGVIELSGREADGTSAKGWGMWEFDQPAFYFSARLMWNTPFDMEKELDLFYNGFFGPAAETMRKFHENFEDAWDNSYALDAKGKRIWDHQICWQMMYAPKFVDSQMALLRQAVKEAGSKEPYAMRLNRMLKSYEKFEKNSRLFRRKVTLNPAVLNVPKTKNVPTLDGKVDDKEWKNAAKATNFLDTYAVYPALSNTEVRMMHDGKNLYLGIKAAPDQSSEVFFPDSKWSKKDPTLWLCDSVEFFIAQKNGGYHQFIFADGDRIFDAYCKAKTEKLNMDWNSHAAIKTSRSENSWQCEVKIPFSDINITPANKKYNINFSRNHYRRKKGDIKYFWEQTGWQPTYGAFSNTEKFGSMILQ